MQNILEISGFFLSRIQPTLGVPNDCFLLFAEISVNKANVQTNMVYFSVHSDKIGAEALAEKLKEKSEEEDDDQSVGVIAISESTIRAVFHHQITSQQVKTAAEKIVRIYKSS